MPFEPRFAFTDLVVHCLMQIEATKALFEAIPLPDDSLVKLRRDASIRSTHYSTKFEGNILGMREVEKVVTSKRNRLGKHEQEVGNYWLALEFLQEEAENKSPNGKRMA